MGLSNLFKPRWQHPDKEIREVAVKKLTNQVILAKIAKHDNISWIRYEAVSNPNFQDQKLLAEIAMTDKETLVCKAAVENLKDLQLLIEFARADKRSDLREAAIGNRNFTDLKLLSKIAKTDHSFWIRFIAVSNPNLNDEKLLADIATTDKDPTVRGAAVRYKKFTDQKLLAEIARTDESSDVRKYALENPNLIDQELIIFITNNDKEPSVRETAAEKINDPNLLLSLIKSSSDPYIIGGAVKGLKRVSPKFAESEIKKLCSKEHSFTEYKQSERFCTRCGYKERCNHPSYTKWGQSDQPDDRDRYTWDRSCTVCDYSEVTQYPPDYR